MYYRQLQQLRNRFDHLKQIYPDMAGSISKIVFDALNVNYFDAESFINETNTEIMTEKQSRVDSNAQHALQIHELKTKLTKQNR